MKTQLSRVTAPLLCCIFLVQAARAGDEPQTVSSETYELGAGYVGDDAYRFGRYNGKSEPEAGLLAPEGVDAARLEAIAAGEALTRDRVNTPCR